MNQLPTLYSRTSTGAIQQWSIVVVDDGYYTVSGQVNGAMVTTKTTKCKAKNTGKSNATTPEEQALVQAQAKWTKQCKTGYTPAIEDVDTCMMYVEPMLAKSLKNYIHKIDWTKGVIVQNKYNGVRCTATCVNGKVVLKSREGEEWLTVPHINKDLEPFFKDFPNAMLDAELYNYDLRQLLNDLIKIVRKTTNITPEHLAKSEKIVRFYCYDGYGFNDGDFTLDHSVKYSVRKEWIDKNLSQKYKLKYYREVPSSTCYSMRDVDAVYRTFLDDNEEGAIIRIPDSKYKHGRSSDLLKYKPVDDDECVILDVQAGTGNYAHRAKTSTVSWCGKTFKCTWKGDEKTTIKILKDATQWVGRTVTFMYNGLTGLGTPNYARIDPKNCLRAD